MNIEIRSLRHVVTLANRLSFRKAADELGITQSTLSRSIQATEDELQARLFDRDRSGVKLTGAGVEFVRRAETVLQSSLELSDAMSRLSHGYIGSVALGLGPLVAKAALPKLMESHRQNNGDVRLSVTVRGYEELMPLLLSEQIDFFIASLPRSLSAPSRVEAKVLGEFPISLLIRTGHPLLNLGSTGEGAARKFPLYASCISELPHQVISEVKDKVEQIPAIRTDDYNLLSQLAQTTDGVWLSSAAVAATEIAAGTLTRLPVEFSSPNTFPVVQYMLRHRAQLPASRALMAKARSIILDQIALNA